MQDLFPATLISLCNKFSTSDLLILGLEIMHSSDLENKLAFSSTKSNFSLTSVPFPALNNLVTLLLLIFSFIFPPPPSPLNCYCILTTTPTKNRRQLFSLKHTTTHVQFFIIYQHHVHISIFSTNTTFLLFSLHHPHQEHTSIVCPKPPPPPPYFYCFPSTATTITITLLLVFLLLLHLHIIHSTLTLY